jgi:hypothetical protein
MNKEIKGHKVVKILYDEDSVKCETPKWHLVEWVFGDSPRTACTGEVFGYGEGSAIYKEKSVLKGGVTCPNCLEIIKWYKGLNINK